MKTNELHRTKRILRRALPLALLLGLLIVVPVLADYLGPDRIETTYIRRRRHCHYVAHWNGTNYYCTLDLYRPPGSGCPSNVAGYFQGSTCGWPGSCGDSGVSCSISSSSSVESCTAGQSGCRSVEQTVTHPPATISGSINCPQTGDNGYCIAAASLSLSGNEPLSGYQIIALEGTRNGETFLWDGSSCTIPLIEGANAFTFWALSSWGDSSLMGNASRSVDTRPPSVSASASGTPGNGSWYVSPVTIEASASDPSPGSGLASFQAAVDGSWGAYSEPITLNDGDHTIELLATDNAGLNDGVSMAFQIDTIAPTTVISDPTGTIWATGAIDLSGASSDLHLDVAEISTDGGSSWSGLSLQPDGSWSTTWDTRTVSDGSHSVQARTRDLAGNVGAAAAVAIQVDNGAPQIGIPASWPIQQRVSINVRDDGIGVERVRLTIHSDEYGDRVYNWSSGPEDFKWDRRFGDIVAPIGGYPVKVEAWDEAGNEGSAWGEIVIPEPDEEEEEEDSTVLSVDLPDEPPATSVDDAAPRIGIPASWPIWQRVAIKVKDKGSGVKRVRLTIHSDEYGERVYNWSSGPDDFKWDRRFGDIIAPIGDYPVEVEAWDKAGNKGSAWGEIVIPEPDEVDEEEEEDSTVLSVDLPDESTEPSGGEAPVPAPTNTPRPPKVVTFGGESSGVEEAAAEEIAPPTGSSNLLWGAAAVAAVGSAMAVVAAQKKKRKDEEKKKAAAAAAFNKKQIALEKERAQKAAQRKWEAEQAAAAGQAAAQAAALAAEESQAVMFTGSYPTTITVAKSKYDEIMRSDSEISNSRTDRNIAIRTMSTITGGYFAGTYGDLVPRVLDTVRECGNRALSSTTGYVLEDLWKAAHNSNVVQLIKRGYAWLNPIKYTEGWDGGITTLNGTTQVQVKSIDPYAQNYSTRVTERANLSGTYGPNQEMVVSTEATEDVITKSPAPDHVRSSDVSHAEAKETTLIARDAVRGSTSSFLKITVNMANRAAVKAGGIGALISGGISLYRNIRDLRAGRISGSTAVARTTVDTLGGTVTAAAGAWTGAMTGAIAGAALGSVIPIAGNIIGAVVGFGVGVATSVGVGTLWNNHIREPLTKIIDHGLSAYSGIAQNVKTIANEVVDRAIESVSNAVETVKSGVSTAVSDVADDVSNFFGKIFGKKT